MRKDEVNSVTHKVTTKCGNMYISITNDREIFVKLGKAGSCAFAWTQVIGKLLTHHLKNNLEAKRIVKQFGGIDCAGMKEGKSCPDAIATILQKWLDEKQS